ncbi:GDT1-like protein 4 [Hibiscus syriacus]|uniref:GDT1-like protein 4 n=1 Tax=Hibiscus syriacus TaxID=106335 RepID=UPI00192490F7|nr:GDT1-like protein 4 [Hibiscus syriacus]
MFRQSNYVSTIGISELAEVEAKLDADSKVDSKKVKEGSKDGDELKKKRRPFLTQFFSPIFLKAFSITFFGEWGDRSQLATIGMAADEDPFGVVLGGILGQALCTVAAVFGGKSLASWITEKIIIQTHCFRFTLTPQLSSACFHLEQIVKPSSYHFDAGCIHRTGGMLHGISL